VYYTAIGASDANGVGSSVPCPPFTACETGTGYVPVLARQLRASRTVTLMNLGIPASVLSPAIEAVGRQYGRDIQGNFVDRQMPFVPRESTLVTVFGGGNDANVVGDALEQGAAGSDVAGYIDRQARAFGADFDRLIAGIRGRAPDAFIIVINVPNLGALPYAARYPVEHRRVLQSLSVAFSREANRQASAGVAILDAMCDAALYASSNFSSDGFHPNDAGYAHLASRLAAIVNGSVSAPASSCAPMQAVR
jgi:lysophospholipase L1-like esterase